MICDALPYASVWRFAWSKRGYEGLVAAVSYETSSRRIAVKTRSGAGYAIAARFFAFVKQFPMNGYPVGALSAATPRNGNTVCHSKKAFFASIGASKNTTLSKTTDAPALFEPRSVWCVDNTDINKNGSIKAASRSLRAEGPTSEARTC